MFTRLAGLKLLNKSLSINIKRNFFEPNFLPPLKKTMKQAKTTIEFLDNNAKHFFVGGERSFSIAVELLTNEKIIAIPTDTVYGLATLAQNSNCIENLYRIKERDRNKPIAICVSSISDINKWAETDHLPRQLLGALLPGSVTVVLKRKPTLNPSLNPGKDTIGIRVLDSKFIRSICKIIKQPLALTSANLSNKPSSLVTDEFRELWPNIDGIFYSILNRKHLDDSFRAGSTVVDLTEPTKFSIIRKGVSFERVVKICYRHGITSTEVSLFQEINDIKKTNDTDNVDDEEDESDKKCKEATVG